MLKTVPQKSCCWLVYCLMPESNRFCHKKNTIWSEADDISWKPGRNYRGQGCHRVPAAYWTTDRRHQRTGLKPGQQCCITRTHWRPEWQNPQGGYVWTRRRFNITDGRTTLRPGNKMATCFFNFGWRIQLNQYQCLLSQIQVLFPRYHQQFDGFVSCDCFSRSIYHTGYDLGKWIRVASIL